MPLPNDKMHDNKQTNKQIHITWFRIICFTQIKYMLSPNAQCALHTHTFTFRLRTHKHILALWKYTNKTRTNKNKIYILQIENEQRHFCAIRHTKRKEKIIKHILISIYSIQMWRKQYINMNTHTKIHSMKIYINIQNKHNLYNIYI